MAENTGIDFPLEGGEDDTELLNPVDDAMVTLLAQGLTYAVVSDILEVSTKTIQRRMQSDHFRARVDELRRQRLSAVTARLVAMSDTALDVIKDVMSSENDRLRFNAAESVIRLGRRHQVEEMQEAELRRRMEAIETVLLELRSEEEL